jgi:protein-tyrosine phosphatase
LAVSDGIGTIIATPHQLGNFAANRGADLRTRTRELQSLLTAEGIALRVLPGADVRIEDGMLAGLRSGEVLTLGDHGRHVLLELPHELYFPLEPVLAQLDSAGMAGILSHPERNQGLLHSPSRTRLLCELVERGCLLQVTAGSLTGGFGPASREFAEELLGAGLIHFLATDAHGVRSRRPILRQAYERAAELAGAPMARQICCENPRRVAEGLEVPRGRAGGLARRRGWRGFFSFQRAG